MSTCQLYNSEMVDFYIILFFYGEDANDMSQM